MNQGVVTTLSSDPNQPNSIRKSTKQDEVIEVKKPRASSALRNQSN